MGAPLKSRRSEPSFSRLQFPATWVGILTVVIAAEEPPRRSHSWEGQDGYGKSTTGTDGTFRDFYVEPLSVHRLGDVPPVPRLSPAILYWLARRSAASVTFANRRTAGCFTCRAFHKSYWDCMFIHNSGVVPKADPRRIAIAAEIPALPLSTRESVTRVIRR